MWIFGYGSILWKVDFPHEQSMIGYIKGYVRRFYQHSIDHRGTVENPGRVVTLLPSDDKEEKVWGKAYGISLDKIDDVINHLDVRERGGYERKYDLFYPKDEPNSPFQIMIYIASEKNKQYAGESSIENIATQVVNAHGPSGSNAEYVLNLAAAMRTIAPDEPDDHLFSLENAVKKYTDRGAL